MVHGLLVALALVAVAASVAFSGAAPASPWRHLYPLPVVLAALRFERGGTLAAVAAVLLHAPFVLPAVERAGPRADILEGLVTFALLLGGGALADALAGRARRERARHETLVAVQRALEGARWLDLALGRARAWLLRRVRADALGLVAREGLHPTRVPGPRETPVG